MQQGALTTRFVSMHGASSQCAFGRAHGPHLLGRVLTQGNVATLRARCGCTCWSARSDSYGLMLILGSFDHEISLSVLCNVAHEVSWVVGCTVKEASYLLVLNLVEDTLK